MNDLITRLKQLSSAEEFFQFFGVDYDEHVVQVNRLHILKRFYQYLHKAQDLAELNEVEMFTRYRELLSMSYQDFVHSSAVQEKVFKVFQDADGQRVSLKSLRETLADRRGEAAAVSRHVA